MRLKFTTIESHFNTFRSRVAVSLPGLVVSSSLLVQWSILPPTKSSSVQSTAADSLDANFVCVQRGVVGLFALFTLSNSAVERGRASKLGIRHPPSFARHPYLWIRSKHNLLGLTLFVAVQVSCPRAKLVAVSFTCCAMNVKDRLRPDSIYKVAYDNDDGLENPRYIIAYWSIRGLGAPLRMMLSAAEVDHWVAFYDVTEGDDGKWCKDPYFNDKAWLKDEYNPLMNFPFLVDCANDRVLSQTNAIFTFLGRELNMLGSNAWEQTLCEELLSEVMDVRNKMVRFAYAASTPTDQHEAETLIQRKGPVASGYDKIELYLKKKKEKHDNASPFLVGDGVTAPDFHLWEMLDQFDGLCKSFGLPSLLDDTRPNLTAFKTAIESLPQIKSYLSAEYMKIPYNNCYARFGSLPDPCQKYQRGMETPWKGNGVVEERRKRTATGGHKRKL